MAWKKAAMEMMYKTMVFEHSTLEVIESVIAQLGSYQALIAVTMIQTLVYLLFGWGVGSCAETDRVFDRLYSVCWVENPVYF